MDPISALMGGLVSGGASLLGASMNTSSQQAINAANIANQNFLNAQNWQHQLYLDTHHIQDLASDAKKAGISPLAALGVSTPGAPAMVGATQQASQAGDLVSRAGQDFGASITKMMDDNSRKAVLQEELLKAQIAGQNADTAGQMLSNSRAARLAAPGSRQGGGEPLTQKFDFHGVPFSGLSKEASQSAMNAASWPLILPWGGAVLGENLHGFGTALDRWSGGWSSHPGRKFRDLWGRNPATVESSTFLP